LFTFAGPHTVTAISRTSLFDSRCTFVFICASTSVTSVAVLHRSSSASCGVSMSLHLITKCRKYGEKKTLKRYASIDC